MINRRIFMLRSAVVLASSLMAKDSTAPYAITFRPLGDPYNTIGVVLDDLFPPLPGVPTAQQLNTLGYIGAVMDDIWVPQSEKEFLRNGAGWLHEESLSMFGKKYYLLEPPQRQQVLDAVSKLRWGDNWLYSLFNYLFESMFCDPLYGANTDGAGWAWLSHEPGYPRPVKVSI